MSLQQLLETCCTIFIRQFIELDTSGFRSTQIFNVRQKWRRKIVQVSREDLNFQDDDRCSCVLVLHTCYFILTILMINVLNSHKKDEDTVTERIIESTNSRD